MNELTVTSLLARYEQLDSSSKAYVAGYADDALSRLEVALSVVERMHADKRANAATRGQLRCVHSRQEHPSSRDAT